MSKPGETVEVWSDSADRLCIATITNHATFAKSSQFRVSCTFYTIPILRILIRRIFIYVSPSFYCAVRLDDNF